ncbi:MAG: serine/threonine protein kinase, partial [Lentisphaeria bacterium]|nr:serine/threonine protein kinase [Lentisphaeria bacterium]
MGEFNFDVGSTISHFRLEKKLGEGGMGAVYLAEDITLSRKIALKFMNRDMLTKLSDENLRRTIETRFIREAKSAAAINHPNLAQIYEANFDSDIWFIAMEYIDGYDLVGKLEKNERFTIEEVLDIAKQTVSGLMFAWDNYKIIHRDIKPHNIMVTHSGIVKIVDLGLAKPMANLDDDLPDVTCAGQAVGTPHYMAPEQAAGEKDIDHSVDIFALGSTLYEILTGQKAFSEKTAAMIYMSQISKQYTPIQELRNDIPDDLARLIEKMLEPTLEERVTDYAELLDLFNRINVSDIGDNDETMIAYDAQTMVNSVAKTIVDSAHSDEYSADHLIMDRYRVLRHIGRNKAGVVYICMDTQLKMECTVKSLYPDREFPGEDFPAIRANFQRLMRDTHQNLVQIRDLMQDETTGELFIVMESLKGLNLREYTHKQISKDGQVDLESCIDVLKNVAQAIDSVNVSLNSVHNDIKPESVYLTENNQVKLLDYGITLIGGTDTTSTGMTVVTKKEIPLESPDYLAPEKWSTTIPGSQSDQYSLAVIIYEMLGRKLPFWISNPDYEVTAENDEDAYKQRLALLKDDVQNKPVPELSMLSPSIN